MKSLNQQLFYIFVSMALTVVGIAAEEGSATPESKGTSPESNTAPAETNTVEQKRPSLLARVSKDSIRDGYDRNGFYVAALGGANFGEDVEATGSTRIGAASNNFSYSTDPGNGWQAGVKLGYALYDQEKNIDEFQLVPAIEIEARYTKMSFQGTGLPPTGGGATFSADFETITVTANALLRFHNDILIPYIGFGGGLAHMSIKDESARYPGGQIITEVDENSEFVPMFHGIFGLERQLVGGLHIFTEYKFQYLPDAVFDFKITGAGNTGKIDLTDYLSHQIEGGLRYHF
jgi:hypothetical protein